MSEARRFAVADSETDPFEFGRMVRPFMWGYFDGRLYRQFSSTRDFVAFARTQPVILYAHNGGKFDWRLIESELDPGPVKIINGRIVEARLGRAILRDSYSILPASLDAITGGKLKIDYQKFRASRRRFHLDEIGEYLRVDCFELYAALERFFTEYGRPLTLAGATLKVWRGMGGLIPKMGPAQFARYEPYYHGGRCEAIRPGRHTGGLYFLDINGAYAHAMTFDQWHGAATNTRKPRARHYERCLIHFEADSDGAFPIRGPEGLSFPHGRGEFKCTGRELATALELRLARRVKIIRAHRFETVSNFGRYVAHFEAIRREAKKNGDRIGDAIAKLFRNGIYGKMAANPHRYMTWHLTRLGGKPDDYERFPPDWDAGKLVGGYRLAGTFDNRDLWARPVSERSKTFYDIALGAQITGHVRAILLEARATVRDPLYCDTDSLICRAPGKLRLGPELGAWKIESMGSEALICGKKLYGFRHDNKARARVGLGPAGERHKLACKGAAITWRKMQRVAKGESVTYKQAAPVFGLAGVTHLKRSIRATCELPRKRR